MLYIAFKHVMELTLRADFDKGLFIYRAALPIHAAPTCQKETRSWANEVGVHITSLGHVRLSAISSIYLQRFSYNVQFCDSPQYAHKQGRTMVRKSFAGALILLSRARSQRNSLTDRATNSSSVFRWAGSTRASRLWRYLYSCLNV